ncbi:DUF6446 family protein [Paracoccus sp. (in: a-proteobacteria)]|uniref:DUF6446 family protein n=1 Tax=Paracoccus sp. TaxID=267 RepID=UPI0026DF33B4|nr:DUF6446 family protein [Paracoccus sp. (in: a-proteobacteria)]MDO5646737.1 DUF6446 family protein [Paracoccus sp. (in: a-proteobacteria)]
MNQGRIAISMLALSAVLAAIAVWYLQVYAFYDDVDEITGTQTLFITQADGELAPLPVRDFRGIDKSSSPLGYRACFTVDHADLAGLPVFADPTPTIGPSWFRCFNARGVGGDLESGAAQGFLSQADIRPGVDRVIAVYPDGRAFAWHQLNETAEEKKVIE